MTMENYEHIAGKHVLIIVENLPVPFDRRVWQEATTLREAGADAVLVGEAAMRRPELVAALSAIR